jgi:UDP-xylose:glucoside alpha-1,3-xylosyltransferase
VVVCGEHRVDEAIVMVKSALLFSLKNLSLNFVIVTEKNLKEIIVEKLENLRKIKKFSFEIFELKFPEENREIWTKLFKPCAAQRLFLPSLLPHLDSVVYVDCDVLFLTSVEYLEMHFR